MIGHILRRWTQNILHFSIYGIIHNNTWQHLNNSPLIMSDWPSSFWNPVFLYVVSVYSTVFCICVCQPSPDPWTQLTQSCRSWLWKKPETAQKLEPPPSHSWRQLVKDLIHKRAQNPANWDLDAEYNISHHKIENYFVFLLRVLDYGTMRTSAKLWKLFVQTSQHILKDMCQHSFSCEKENASSFKTMFVFLLRSFNCRGSNKT